jgi:BirA family transcriptional regulator, biotin operon repressor / biotin---[acetyl-CoA-carboxylase] ligase
MNIEVRLPAGHRLIHFAEIDSTNAEALRCAAKGERGPIWFWADRQMQGRGRLGRGWVSEKGNLYATLLIALAVKPSVAAGLSIVAPLAVLSTFKSYLRPTSRLELKWPNDVLLEGRKAAGILVETTLQSDLMIFAIGCGLNLQHAPPATRYGAITLAEQGVAVPPGAALETLAAEIDGLLLQWDGGAGFAALRTRWLQYAKGLGRPISLTTTGETIEGYFEGLGENGSLLLRNQTGMHEFHAGEISFADFSESPP